MYRQLQGTAEDDFTQWSYRPALRATYTKLAPGADRTTDDEILDWVKKAAETTYHPVGTCRIGSDPMAVVDAQLRVHGIAGLRVAIKIGAKPRS